MPRKVFETAKDRARLTTFGGTMKSRVLFFILGTILFLPALTVRAQFSASLSGTVQDATHAVVPGATVTLLNTANQQSRTAVASGTGSYRFSELSPGSYTITAAAKGFKTTTLSNIAIAAETPRSTDITLATGGNTESVNVNAEDTPTLQTADASIGSTIDSVQIQRLPVVGGDPYELLRTAPGITGDSARAGAGNAVYLPNGGGPGQSNRGVFQTENQVQISASGQGVSANNYLIDGVSVNSLGQAGAAVITPNQESVSQLTVVSTSYSAEDGRNTGAQIKTVTRSGTNTLHGSVYFRYDEPGLNAYNKDVNLPSLSYAGPPLRVNNKERDYTASLGGPIIRDRLFLFGSYEGFTFLNNAFANQWTETPQFDAAVIAARPNTVTSSILTSPGIAPRIAAILTPTCSYYTAAKLPCQVVGNGIDVGSFGPATQNNHYFDGNAALQTGAGLDGVPDLQFVELVQPSRARGNQWNGRVDFHLSDRNQISFSAFVTKVDAVGTSGSSGSRPGADVPQKPLNEAGTFIFIHTFSPAWLNEFRANGTRFADNQIVDAGSSVNYGIPYINIQNLPVPTGVQYGVSQSPATPGVFAENTYEVRDSVVHTFGSHTLRIGGEYRWEQDNNNLGGGSRPVYAFAGLFNFANNAPAYEGIAANPSTGGPANTARYLRSQTLGLFVQHDWMVTPTFTVNTGLRYEYFAPIHNKNQDLNLPVLGPPGNELGGATLVPHNSFYNGDFSGYSPKLGFAWTPAAFQNKTVIRGGFARAMNRLNFSLFDNAVEDGPGFFNFGLCCGSSTTPLAANAAGVPQIQYSIGTGNSPTSFAPNPALHARVVNNLPVNPDGTPIQIEVYGAPAQTKIPYAYLFSLEIQTTLPANFTFTVGYQGSVTHHLPRLVNQNFLYSTTNSPFSSAYFANTDSNANYNALNVQLNKNFHKGYQLSAIYSYAKSLDQVSNGYGANSLANQTNPADNRTEYGPSDFDLRHRVTVSGLWDIPGTRGERALKILTNGWQVNAIYTFHTGFPFTPVVINLASNPYVPTAATISPARPYAYLGGFQASCTNGNYINGNDVRNTRFITTPPAGVTYRPGIGRNSFSGPCYTDTDLSVAREQRFDFRDHPLTLRFQANLFNAFNSLNLLPFVNGNADASAQVVGQDPTNASDASARALSNFGKPTGADAGRQIEFFARLFF